MPAARSLSILVSGFEGLRVTEKTLKECFEIVGEVKEIVIPPSGLFAETTIRYADAESAARAVQRYHMGFLNGKTLRVRLAEAEARVPPPPPPPDSKRRTVGAAPQKNRVLDAGGASTCAAAVTDRQGRRDSGGGRRGRAGDSPSLGTRAGGGLEEVRDAGGQALLLQPDLHGDAVGEATGAWLWRRAHRPATVDVAGRCSAGAPRHSSACP